MRNILFVCTGNTCRSSMAENIAKYLLQAWGETDIEVSSAGVFAQPDAPASDHAIAVLKEGGLDLSEHRARQLTVDMVDKADIVFTMTRSHKNMVLSLVPQAEGKVYALKEYALDKQQDSDVSDPFGGDLETYRQTAKELSTLVEDALLKYTNRNT